MHQIFFVRAVPGVRVEVLPGVVDEDVRLSVEEQHQFKDSQFRQTRRQVQGVALAEEVVRPSLRK